MLHHPPRGYNAGAMPSDARQSPPRRPAAIAIHDDGDMKSSIVTTLCHKASKQDIGSASSCGQ
jgi:hypothetical protein